MRCYVLPHLPAPCCRLVRDAAGVRAAALRHFTGSGGNSHGRAGAELGYARRTKEVIPRNRHMRAVTHIRVSKAHRARVARAPPAVIFRYALIDVPEHQSRGVCRHARASQSVLLAARPLEGTRSFAAIAEKRSTPAAEEPEMSPAQA